MDVATVLTLVQTLLQLLDSPISREIDALWGYKSQLQKLRNTMSTIQAVLANVERLQSQQLPITIPQVMLERLQEAVYQADDLFDEVATVSLMHGNTLSKEVVLFFSRFNHFYYVFTKSREVQKIRDILDDIAKDQHFVRLFLPANNVVEVSNINSSRETHSFVSEESEVIGRDKDKQIVISSLLQSATEENVSVVSIVGMGGLGKTALAKLVYNDDIIQSEFSPRMWVCVSTDFDVKSLLGQILALATDNTNNDSGLSKDQLQTKLRQQLVGNKYLLVLDDVWNESSNKWNELRNILIQGGTGSSIMVTTRSKRVANVVGSHHTHELQGLSDYDSWKLFQKVTAVNPHLVEIGKEIVRKCFNVPLAIRFVGSFLQGKNESVWLNLKNADLARIGQDGDDGIIPVLKISYNHLPPHLKSCFNYCAIFPKDYNIKKDELTYQWMAHGFLKPLNNGMSLEDLGEDYFMKLLQGCFFQDVKKDDTSGVITSYKMHDLVHDLALIVCNKDATGSLNANTLHVFVDDAIVQEENEKHYLAKMKRVRTCVVRQSIVKRPYFQFPYIMRNLRVLDLSEDWERLAERSMQKLSSRIGELLHLRYLDLSGNFELSMLPNSITQLYNLQTLKLEKCTGLVGLPRELSKLVNLRYLDISYCDRVSYMPPGMNSMSSLHKLTVFVAGDVKNNARGLREGDIGKLKDLKYLENLTGHISIVMKDGWKSHLQEGRYLINKPLLDEIQIFWNHDADLSDDRHAEALMQGLQPHPNLKRLNMYKYPAAGFPRWGHSLSENLNTSLPNLVHIRLHLCKRLERLPLLSQLHHLKTLSLFGLVKLEYVESRIFRKGDDLVFFPSLERLMLWELPELKGSLIVPEEEDINSNDNDDNSDPWRCLAPTLRYLKLWGLPKVVKLPKGMQHLTALRFLDISDCANLEEIPAWIGCLSSLRHLYIANCESLKSLPEEMRHLTGVTQLQIDGCSPELKERCKKPSGSDWPKIQHIPSILIYQD